MNLFRQLCLAGATGLAAIGASAQVQAQSIGINLGTDDGQNSNTGATNLPAGTFAGVVPQANFNNVAATDGDGSAMNLVDNTGAATTADITFDGGGTFNASGAAAADGNELLNKNFVFGTVTGTVSEIPFSVFDVILFLSNDAGGRATTTTLTDANGVTTTLTSTSIVGSSAGQVDGDPATPFAFSFATPDGFPAANVARFTGVTGSSFSFSTSAPGNSAVSGIQIVAVPEPAGLAVLALTGLGLLARRRRA